MLKPKPIWHVGLLQVNRTAVLQFRRTVDELSCDILFYYGTRETFKWEAKERLKALRLEILAKLNQKFPGPNTSRTFTKVRID
jgi:hypothetical protein